MKDITVAKGDGIGPEIMDATLKILHEAGPKFELKKLKLERTFISAATQLVSSLEHGIHFKRPGSF